MARSRNLLIALMLIATGACRTPSPSVPRPVRSEAPVTSTRSDAPIRITLAATNDLHGWVHAHEAILADGTRIQEGGVAALSGYLKILREENPGGVLLLDAGDLFQGTLASNLTEGEVVIQAYNHMAYTAAAIGNHEFDYGPVGPVSVATSTDVDPFGALKARLEQSRFPMLAANIYEAATGGRPTWLPNDGTALVTVKGVKIGLLGLVTPSTPYTTNPVNVSTLRFGSLVPETEAAARRLRAQGAEVIVGIAHAGGICGKCDDPHDLSTCDTEAGEIFELLLALEPGTVDAMIAGHTHAEIAHFVNGTPVVETRGLGRALAVIELSIDPRTRRVIPERTILGRNVTVCTQVDEDAGTCEIPVLKRKERVKLVPATFRGREVVADRELERLIAPAMARVEAEQHRSLGLDAPSLLGRNYEAESALGNFLADSLREMEKADVVLLNPGGLRSDIAAGDVTYGDVYEVIPFDNTIATLTLTGEELKRVLIAAYGGRKGVFQQSGLQLKLSACPGQGRLREVKLAGGKPLDPTKKYRVVMPDFLARGGDGLGAALASIPQTRVDLGMTRELNFRDALVAWWQAQGMSLVAPPSGRTTFVGSLAGCNPGSLQAQH